MVYDRTKRIGEVLMKTYITTQTVLRKVGNFYVPLYLIVHLLNSKKLLIDTKLQQKESESWSKYRVGKVSCGSQERNLCPFLRYRRYIGVGG